MDSEEIIIPEASAAIVNEAIQTNEEYVPLERLLRTIESSVSSSGTLNPYEG